MLCNVLENKLEKCAKYWNSKNMYKYTINEEKKIDKNKYIIRILKLTNNFKKTERAIYQIHFTGWPDHEVPEVEGGKIFETFINIIKDVDRLKGDNPIVVHCSAGVGRTGTFISIYFLYKEIMEQINANLKEIQFSIFNMVRKLKEMRILSVQTLLQYNFIYQFVRYLLLNYNI